MYMSVFMYIYVCIHTGMYTYSHAEIDSLEGQNLSLCYSSPSPSSLMKWSEKAWNLK